MARKKRVTFSESGMSLDYSIDDDAEQHADDGGRWLEFDERGRAIFRFGRHTGDMLDDVSMDGRGRHYIRWILDQADFRPTPAEELAMREAADEIGSSSGTRPAAGKWVNVVIGTRSFSIPSEVSDLFDAEMNRRRQLCSSDVQAFESIVASAAGEYLESLM